MKREHLNKCIKNTCRIVQEHQSAAHYFGDGNMGRVVATIKVFPEDIIIGKDHIQKEIERILPKDVTVHKFVEDPIAFGLVALIVHLILPEEDGQLEKVENALQTIEGVRQIEVLLVRRV